MSTHAPSSAPSAPLRVTRLIVNGAHGRMGSRVCALARGDARFALVGALSRSNATPERDHASEGGASAGGGVHDAIVRDLASIVPGCADVVVDFSSDEGTRRAIEVASGASAALLVGTTALSDATRQALRDQSQRRAVLIAPNTSLGVTLLARLLAVATRVLGSGYDASIVESHHTQKKDAPSGTALRLAWAIRGAGGAIREDQVLAIRAGDIIGEHRVQFAGPGEVIELSHRATSRDLFVRGALHAAAWLARAKPGMWTMDDVLGLGDV